MPRLSAAIVSALTATIPAFEDHFSLKWVAVLRKDVRQPGYSAFSLDLNKLTQVFVFQWTKWHATLCQASREIREDR
jgi:hypothetical protein